MQDSVENIQNIKQQLKYKKIKILGEGSMGRAYLVQSANDQQLYVMKRINIGFLSQSQKENAARQAKLHSMVVHENVIEFKEIYQTTKQKLCIIMEYAEGGDLDAHIKEQNGKPFSQEQVLTYFSQICLGLRAIHQKQLLPQNRKIVHRDLKGANIFLTKNHKVKIGDFGISKVIDQTVQASKTFVGTPYYLSPEMVEGKPYSTKADIWALGVILYNLCTHKLPFQANSLPLLALKILKGSFAPITGNYSRQLKTLILNLLQVNPKKRPTIDEIICKPLLSKYVPKQEIPIKNAIIPAANKIPKVNSKTVLSKPKPKPRVSEEQTKNQEKQRREQAKQKRNQLRKEMKEDLKKKRKDKQVTEEKTGFEVTSEPKKLLQKRPPKVVRGEKAEEKTLKKDIPKPWKHQRSQSKKEVQIEMYLPEDKPKPIPEKQQIIEPQNDFKVQIYVSQRNYQSQPPHLLNQMKQQEEKHEESEISEDQSEELSEQIEGEHNLNDILEKVNGAKLAADGLQSEYCKDICLYEESQNFQTVEFSQQKKQQIFTNNKEEDDSLKYINNSENLEECRQILEDALGEEDFIKGYSILNEHLQESNERRMKGDQLQDYTFNRQVIRKKLPFISDENFSKYIILLYTLIILEDEQMKKNLEIDD